MQTLVPYLIKNGQAWILSERARHDGTALPLVPQVREALEPFFEAVTLDAARVCFVRRIENPPFYSELESSGISIPLDFRQMSGITFVDVVLISQEKSSPSGFFELLFHEFVHVAQYRYLGVDRFVHDYVEGWAANGFNYYGIPLERHAYQLQQLFTVGRQQPFSVEQSVRRCFP